MTGGERLSPEHEDYQQHELSREYLQLIVAGLRRNFNRVSLIIVANYVLAKDEHDLPIIDEDRAPVENVVSLLLWAQKNAQLQRLVEAAAQRSPNNSIFHSLKTTEQIPYFYPHRDDAVAATIEQKAPLKFEEGTFELLAQKCIIKAFGRHELLGLVAIELNQIPEQIFPSSSSWGDRAAFLIEWAQEHEINVLRLISICRRANPDNVELRDLEQQLVDSGQFGDRLPDPRIPPTKLLAPDYVADNQKLRDETATKVPRLEPDILKSMSEAFAVSFQKMKERIPTAERRQAELKSDVKRLLEDPHFFVHMYDVVHAVILKNRNNFEALKTVLGFNVDDYTWAAADRFAYEVLAALRRRTKLAELLFLLDFALSQQSEIDQESEAGRRAVAAIPTVESVVLKLLTPTNSSV